MSKDPLLTLNETFVFGVKFNRKLVQQKLAFNGKTQPNIGLCIAAGVVLATTNGSIAQENYVPPTYAQSEAARAMPAAPAPNWVPTDQIFSPVPGDTPREPEHPFFEVDWSLGVVGTHTGGTDTGKNFVSVTPEVSLTHIGLRGQISLDATTTLSVNDEQSTRMNDGQFSLNGLYEVDSVSQLRASLDLGISQDDVNAPGTAVNIEQTPYEANLIGEVGFVRQFGKISIDASTQAERFYRSPTALLGAVMQDNAEFSFTKLGGSLRAGYSFTPEMTLFVQGDIARDWYDAVSVTSGEFMDGVDYGVSVGATVNWRDVLVVEASVGQVVREHISPVVGDRGEAVYALNFDYNPTDVLSIGGEISTNILPANGTEARPRSVAYHAAGNVGFAVADWIGLRATQSGDWVFPNEGVNTQTTFNTGFGVDVAVNKNIDVNMDYRYTWAEILPTDEDPEHQHTWMLGIKYSR